MRCFAVAAPGLERVVAAELAALPGVGDVHVVAGGAEWSGDRESVLRANLWLRVASRVLVRLGEVRARDFARFRRELAALPWQALAPTVPVRLEPSITARRCRLYHTGALAQRLAEALAGRLPLTDDPAAPAQGVVIRGEGDVFTVSVDSSGELLHRRGYREETAKAPLRETLAAGVLALAGWDPRTALHDPTCGSGTIVLEAAQVAIGRAPGARRAFAFERWAGHDPALWARLGAEAAAGELAAPPAPLAGTDRAAGAVAAARRNAERAGLAEQVRFEQVELARVAPVAAGPGLIVSNPPYGRRVLPGDAGALARLYADLGRLARRAPGWRLAVLAGPGAPIARLGLEPTATFPLVTGGLPVRLLLFEPAAARGR